MKLLFAFILSLALYPAYAQNATQQVPQQIPLSQKLKELHQRMLEHQQQKEQQNINQAQAIGSNGPETKEQSIETLYELMFKNTREYLAANRRTKESHEDYYRANPGKKAEVDAAFDEVELQSSLKFSGLEKEKVIANINSAMSLDDIHKMIQLLNDPEYQTVNKEVLFLDFCKDHLNCLLDIPEAERLEKLKKYTSYSGGLHQKIQNIQPIWQRYNALSKKDMDVAVDEVSKKNTFSLLVQAYKTYDQLIKAEFKKRNLKWKGE